MKKVALTRNATLQKDADDCFWLHLEVPSSGQSFSINLTAAMSNDVTYEVDEDSQNVLDAFMAEQERASTSLN